MTKKKKDAAEGLKFESALEKLEKIVDEMESGDLPLEEILRKYEEGSGLVNYCARKLAEAEKRIEILMKNKEGELVARPFDAEAGDSGDADAGAGQDGKDDKELF